jgi:hypothetical protein
LDQISDSVVGWTPGDTIVMRGIWKGKLWWACPAFVVRDTPEMIALHWPVGTPTLSPIRRPTVEDMLYNRIHLQERNWTDNDVLSLATPGSAHSIYVMWEAGVHKLRCWYVQLEESLRRSPLGFDTMDHILDIVIKPDRSGWGWKDEDEFSDAEAIGVYTHEQAQSIRLEGERVIAQLNANASPFCDGWENWIPPVEWGIPSFPQGWEELPL